MIYDAYGRAVKTTALKKEFGAPSIGSIRTPFFESVAGSLTPARLLSVLQQADSGDILEYLTVAEEIEERYWHYRSVISTRKLAVGKLPVRVEISDDTKENLRDAVDELIETPHFSGLVFALSDAISKSFSACEIMWDTGVVKNGKPMWWPSEYRWRDPRHFTVDRETLSQIRLLTDEQTALGEELQPFKWILHKPTLKMGAPIRGGLARLAVIGYMVSNYNLKDWLAFNELFGIPTRIGRYDESASKDDQRKLLSAVRAMGSDGAGIIPKSMEVELINAANSTGGDSLFQGLAEFVNKEISKVVLGQTMTTEDGSSLAQAKVHEDVRQDLIEADGQQLADTINRDLIKPFIDLNFGTQKVYPRLIIEPEDVEDLSSLSEQYPKLAQAGVRISERWVADKWGIPEPEEGERLLTTPEPDGEPIEDDGEPPKKPAPDNTDAKIAEAVNRAIKGEREQMIVSLMKLAEKSKTLNAKKTTDVIDDITEDHLADAAQFMGPMLRPILDAVNHAKSFDDVKKALNALAGDLDKTDVITELATAMFKARGVGDATDEV